MKIRICLVFLMSLFLLAGCDPASSFKKTVENNTGYNLLIYAYGNKANSTKIPSNQRTTLTESGGLGGNVLASCIAVGDSIICEVEGRSDLKVVKDFNDDNDWIRNSSGSSRKGYQTECKMIISNSDIVTQ